jgi:hypothetical protein
VRATKIQRSPSLLNQLRLSAANHAASWPLPRAVRCSGVLMGSGGAGFMCLRCARSALPDYPAAGAADLQVV